MRKIYYQDKQICLHAATPDQDAQEIVEKPVDFRKYYPHFFTSNGEPVLSIYCKDIEQTWNQLCDDFYVFEAAGGCILNEEGELLCIFRNGKWDLPKGKMEEGELPAETAVREVEEETGLSSVEIIESLPTTFHIYKLNSKDVIKKTYWYLMKASKSQKLIPQQEEGIEEIRWVSPENLRELTQNTYASLMDLFALFQK